MTTKLENKMTLRAYCPNHDQELQDFEFESKREGRLPALFRCMKEDCSGIFPITYLVQYGTMRQEEHEGGDDLNKWYRKKKD